MKHVTALLRDPRLVLRRVDAWSVTRAGNPCVSNFDASVSQWAEIFFNTSTNDP